MSVLLSLIVVGLAGLFALLVDKLRRFERLPSPPEKTSGPRVSVLIPARDEERAIGDCLAALSVQEGVDMDIRVLDDGSGDRTAEIVRASAARDPRIALMEGAPLPAGWKGKPHACHQLAEAATGEWLLFVDADVRLGPRAIALALGMRALLAWRLRQSAWAVLGHPLALAFLLALGLRSYGVTRAGRTVPWKGRTYAP